MLSRGPQVSFELTACLGRAGTGLPGGLQRKAMIVEREVVHLELLGVHVQLIVLHSIQAPFCRVASERKGGGLLERRSDWR